MARLYLQLQVDFEDDEKVARLYRYGRDARALRDLLVSMWRYCKREKSNGRVPDEIVGKLVYPDPPKVGLRDADRLVECGLAERVEDGYYLPGFLKHNKSREQIEADRVKKQAAGKVGGKASGEARRAEADAKQSRSSLLRQGEARGESTEGSTPAPQSSLLTHVEGEGDRPVGERPPAPCPLHDHWDHDEPCRPCGRVRAWDEAAPARKAAADKRAAAAKATAIAECGLCDPAGFVELDNGAVTHCDHKRLRAVSA